MAGGKLTARQKMINMMYLVLTALLALNISKEVLHAFVVVNIGLLQQKANIEEKNNAVILEFENQVKISKNNPKTKSFNDDAIKVHKLSQELNDYIEKLKVDMVVFTDGVKEDKAKERILNPFKIERKDDYDKTTNFFGTNKGEGTVGKAHDLKEKLTAYKAALVTFIKSPVKATKDAVMKNLSILDLEVPKESEHKGGGEKPVSWENFYFYHQPQSAALVELTKWQNIVRGAESTLLTYLFDQISATAFKFDAVLAAIIPKSNFVTSGSNFEAEVFLAAFSSAVKPKIVYGTAYDSISGNVAGGVELTPDKFTADGRGHISIPASGAGERTCEGIITMTQPTTGVETHYPFSTKYNVSPPSATVSAINMNVMYRGLDNPIEVGVPGFAPNQLSVGCSGGSMSGGNGKYSVKPGSGKEVVITVGAKDSEGNSKSMGSYKFRVKSVPTPLVTWAGQRSGAKVTTAATGNPLIPLMEDFDFPIYPVITSFDVMYNGKGGIAGGTVTGNQIPSNMATQIKALPRGSRIIFSDVKMTVPGGERKTNNAVFTIQ